MFGYNIANGPNPDFICLIKCREKISDELGIDMKNIELSMGMSSDYEHAVRYLNAIYLLIVMINFICLHTDALNAIFIFYYRLNLAVQM